MTEEKDKEVLDVKTEEDEIYKRYDWREKLTTRDDRIKYLKTALRYWYSNEWYGSERQK